MAFTATVLKYDPYRRFKFLVKWDGAYVAGISKLTGLTQTIEVVDWRVGGGANTDDKIPGQTRFAPLNLERGLSADTAFVDWMKKVSTQSQAGGTATESVHDFRKDLQIEVYNLCNEKVLVINVYKAWPSQFGFGDLDAMANHVLLERIVLQHEGWEIEEQPDSAEER